MSSITMKAPVKEFVPVESMKINTDFVNGAFNQKQMNSARLVSTNEFAFNLNSRNQEVYSNYQANVLDSNRIQEDVIRNNQREPEKTETQRKFKTMRKTEICTKWEAGFCKWAD